MEQQDKLNKPIGTRETETLKPLKVTIVSVKLEPVKFDDKSSEKVVLSCKHPDKEELINISKAKVMRGKDKLKVIGIWYYEDDDGNIGKKTVLADVLNFVSAENVSALVGKEFETVLDENGYLCLKAYN